MPVLVGDDRVIYTVLGSGDLGGALTVQVRKIGDIARSEGVGFGGKEDKKKSEDEEGTREGLHRCGC